MFSGRNSRIIIATLEPSFEWFNKFLDIHFMLQPLLYLLLGRVVFQNALPHWNVFVDLTRPKPWRVSEQQIIHISLRPYFYSCNVREYLPKTLLGLGCLLTVTHLISEDFCTPRGLNSYNTSKSNEKMDMKTKSKRWLRKNTNPSPRKITTVSPH